MKTRDIHSYHGITNNDSVGWAIQIKLLGKYRVLRAYAFDAYGAARRHDIALKILEAFTEPTAEPNFPDEFDKVEHHPDAGKLDKDEQLFRKMVFEWRDELTKDVENAGGDVNELDIKRHQAVEKQKHVRQNNQILVRAEVMKILLKAEKLLPTAGLPDLVRAQCLDRVEQLIQIIRDSNH